MKESLYPIFEWFDQTALATMIKESIWLFAGIMSIHLVTFAALGGCLLIVDLRLMNLVLRGEDPKALALSVRPWLWTAMIGTFITGFLMFVSETGKLYHNDPFWSKMRFLVLGLIFLLTVRRWALGQSPERLGHWSKVIGLTNIVLWSGVAWGGRWIGFW